MSSGRVVVLDGGSSAGKSSLALALQRLWEARGECWVIFGWDDFVPRLPSRWMAIPGMVGDLADEGARYTPGDGTATFVVGDVGRRVLAAYHGAVRAMADAGIDVIVDEVLLTRDDWDDWQDALRGIDARWVHVTCSPEVAARREVERGDRLPGLSHGTAERAHVDATYDVGIDTSATTAESAALALDALLH
jgi:chloramphenicol 3-O phosphotransferase